MRRNKRRSADVDITPLIDVLFMLIIFFVLTASFLHGKIDVDLPTGKGESKSMEKAITIIVNKNGAISWDGRNISKDDLSPLAKESTGKEILIAGDKEAEYGTVAEILSILKEAGINSTGLLMQGGEH
jgi:biopolymer transport protein ExbD